MPEFSNANPFGALFGHLPEPAPGPRRSSGEDKGWGAGPAPAGPSTGAIPVIRESAAATPAPSPVPPAADPAAAGSATEPPPMSRREAREAAARQASTGATPAAAAPAAPAAGAPAAPAARAGTGSHPRYDGPVETEILDVTADDPWLFTRAAEAPTAPYSRTGGAQSRTQPAPAATATADHADAETALESLFAGNSSTDDIGAPPPKKGKRRRRIGGWIALGVVLMVLAGIAGGGLWVWNTYEGKIREIMGWEEPKDYAAGQAEGESYVTIASGDTGQPISQSLYEAGVTKTPMAFYDYLIKSGQNPPFVPGVFKLQKRMTSEAALAALLDPKNKMENTAQLREGLTVKASLPILAEATGLPLKDLQAAVAKPSDYGVKADSLEGWLFPATYTFDPGVTAKDVIKRLVDRTVQSLDSAQVPAEDRQRILTIASIIQREARFEADFYKVSRVIQNRLNPKNNETFGLLQMDSTAQYGYGEEHSGTASSSAAALADDNPWNTYKHAGLPIGPIANPGDKAIDAAMHPVAGDWLYFVTVNLDTGETVFTDNLADHNRAVQQWVTWCKAHPDSGC